MSLQRCLPLDGLRCVCIGLVVISHCRLGHVIPGGLGVTIFFGLSGFLITHLFLAEYADTGSIRFGRFALRRGMRLWPAYFTTLFIALGVSWLNIWPWSADGLLSLLLHYVNYQAIATLGDPNGSSIPRGLGICWSLSVEEHFYLCWPFLFTFLHKAAGKSSRNIILFYSGLLAAGCGLRVWLWMSDPSQMMEHRIYFATDTRFDSMLWGCLAAELSAATKPGHSPKRLTCFISGICCLLLSLMIRDEAFRATLRFSLQGAGVALILPYLLLDQGPIHRLLSFQPIPYLGKISYEMYLTHLLIIYVVEDHISLSTPALIIVSGSLTIAASSLLHHLITRPVMSLRTKVAQ